MSTKKLATSPNTTVVTQNVNFHEDEPLGLAILAFIGVFTGLLAAVGAPELVELSTAVEVSMGIGSGIGAAGVALGVFQSYFYKEGIKDATGIKEKFGYLKNIGRSLNPFKRTSVISSWNMKPEYQDGIAYVLNEKYSKSPYAGGKSVVTSVKYNLFSATIMQEFTDSPGNMWDKTFTSLTKIHQFED